MAKSPFLASSWSAPRTRRPARDHLLATFSQTRLPNPRSPAVRRECASRSSGSRTRLHWERRMTPAASTWSPTASLLGEGHCAATSQQQQQQQQLDLLDTTQRHRSDELAGRAGHRPWRPSRLHGRCVRHTATPDLEMRRQQRERAAATSETASSSSPSSASRHCQTASSWTRAWPRERSGGSVRSKWSALGEAHMASRSHAHWRSGSKGIHAEAVTQEASEHLCGRRRRADAR